jgi:hypothetical protein
MPAMRVPPDTTPAVPAGLAAVLTGNAKRRASLGSYPAGWPTLSSGSTFGPLRDCPAAGPGRPGARTAGTGARNSRLNAPAGGVPGQGTDRVGAGAVTPALDGVQHDLSHLSHQYRDLDHELDVGTHHATLRSAERNAVRI